MKDCLSVDLLALGKGLSGGTEEEDIGGLPPLG